MFPPYKGVPMPLQIKKLILFAKLQIKLITSRMKNRTYALWLPVMHKYVQVQS